jgi:hypothetical protein
VTSKNGECIADEGSALIARLLAHPDRASGEDFNVLLSLFFRGLSITKLRELLECPNDRLIAGGLFIAEELGAKASPVLRQIVNCLDSHDPKIRQSAYSTVATCSSLSDPGSFAHVTLGMRDADPGCRKIAILWMMRVDESILAAALHELEDKALDPQVQEGLRLLIENQGDAGRTTNWLQDHSPAMRKIGVISAGRLGQAHPDLLQSAARSEDEDVRVAATAQMQFLAIRQKHQRPKE